MFSARYGKGTKFVDVTDIVKRRFVKGDKIVIPRGAVFNRYFSDPIYGQVKELQITVGTTVTKIGERDNKKVHQIALPVPQEVSRAVATEAPREASRVGVVITTHGQAGFYVRQCIDSFLRTPEPLFIVLFVNESSDPLTLSIERDYPQVRYVYVANQKAGGGLTGTWNRGARMCMEAGCDIVILSNDDLMFAPNALAPILAEARKPGLKYYGPLTNAPGPAECNRPQLALAPQNKGPFELKFKGNHSNLNGFFMVFPRASLEANMFDATNYFDPSKPFGGNETEWFVRFRKKGGVPIVVPKSFIYHYKNASWRPANRSPSLKERTCIFTINTGGYETKIQFRGDKYGVDSYYFADSFATLYRAIAQGWHPIYVELISGSTKLTQRTIKTACHRYLPDKYDISLYMDGNIQPKFTSIDKLFNFAQVTKYDLICYKHPRLSTVAQERDLILRAQFETRARLDGIMKMLRASGFKDKGGHSETAVLIRWHKRLVAFGEEWASMMPRCIRDQMTFDYLLWKHRVKYRRVNKFPTVMHRHSGNTRGKIVKG